MGLSCTFITNLQHKDCRFYIDHENFAYWCKSENVGILCFLYSLRIFKLKDFIYQSNRLRIPSGSTSTSNLSSTIVSDAFSVLAIQIMLLLKLKLLIFIFIVALKFSFCSILFFILNVIYLKKCNIFVCSQPSNLLSKRRLFESIILNYSFNLVL